MSKRKPIAVVDFDSAHYIGSEEDGVYFDVAAGPKGWYVSADVDCNTGHWVDTLVTDDGPYLTEADAVARGTSLALDWCYTNDVRVEDEAAVEPEPKRVWTTTETHGAHLFVPVKAQTGCAVCGFAKGHHPTKAQLKAMPQAAPKRRKR